MNQLISALSVTIVLLGAGCVSGTPVPVTQEPTPVNQEQATVPTTTVETAAATSSVFNYAGTPAFSFAYTGEATTSGSLNENAFVHIDMGTVVKNPGDRSVPTRSLEAFVISATDTQMNGCYFSDSTWPKGYEPASKEQKLIGTNQFCITSETDAAAGNRYFKQSYALQAGDRVIVMQFVVHSVVCENYPNPTEQCVAFDEARDTQGFEEIVKTVKVGTE